ncbi:hypothetical protein GDO81_022161 [Engystomops pustulosus]|uniref:Uncharacterized protein n=1 Tax=Engystomops pustulosus TaxID=76066 RepID=A0AAV6YMR4_ENGPU|nr:hypothetical protein GDO81_022161 [Engystomops pustulosus]
MRKGWSSERELSIYREQRGENREKMKLSQEENPQVQAETCLMEEIYPKVANPFKGVVASLIVIPYPKDKDPSPDWSGSVLVIFC